ncbi:MAG: DoxX family protein [Acidobacteria bacterium]|nr:MAG: DoxX family protein [Acidobacteriota bacterium]
MNALKRFESIAYSLLRIVAGFLFVFHGLQKILGMFGGPRFALASMPGAAGIIEIVGGVLVMIGLFATPAAFICSGEMAFAYFMVHQPKARWPIQNQGELAVLYAFLFLFIATRGNGVISVGRGRG